MDAPSQTVFAVDTKPLMTGNGNQAWAYRHWVDSPALYTIPDACGSWAWGTNNGWDYNQTTEGPTSPGSYGIAGDEQGPTGTDRVSLRHNGGTDVIFCDGHVKWMTPGNLAAGTNWSATTPAGNIVVTDLSKYLWSLRKSGGCDIRIDCNGNNTEENM
jgi:prepilin-type processing-associated H-X9-DG protein